MDKITITAEDGYPISALYGSPVEAIDAPVIISSATGIRKEFYINFARSLIEQGFPVLLYDYRGIGASAPANLKTSTAYAHDWGLLDMNAALDYMTDLKKHSDIIWLGHSLGAQFVGFLNKQQHIKKVISLSAAVGYWGYFPFPKNIIIWMQWYVISPILVKVYGYGPLKKVGWGENIPKNAFMEWRKWCMNKSYYKNYLNQTLQKDKFYHFKTPIVAVYPSDDFIANDKTVSMMMRFFPNAPIATVKIPVKKYTNQKVGHTGIFRRRFEESLWPVLFDIIKN